MMNPNEAKHALDRAVFCLNNGLPGDTVAYAEHAIALAPDNGFAHMVLGVALTQVDQGDAALPVLERAARLSPGDAQVRYNLAVTLQKAGHTLRAMAEYRQCLAVDPDFRDALWNYGELLRLREHFELALTCFDRLFAIEGKRRPKAAHRMAVCSGASGQSERADALFLEQIGTDDDSVTHWEYAHFLLQQQRFDEAWPHYARRFDAGEKIMVQGMRLPCPAWQGQFQAGATLIITGEQGIGDEILFAAFVPELLAQAKRAGMRVVLVCRPHLLRLFRASFPGAAIEPPASLGEGGSVAALVHDAAASNAGGMARPVWQAHMGDLPQWIAKPEPRAYLTPDAADVHAARELIGSRGDMQARPDAKRPLRIGLVWSANPVLTQSNRIARNVPSHYINGWLANLEGVQFYSLMPAAHVERVAEVPDIALVDLADFVTDFSRTAAAMQCMDAVVSVCTSSANLAGALALDLHVLLQARADWRWAGNGTAWYPRAQIYQQARHGDWSPCLAQLALKLRQNVTPVDHRDDHRAPATTPVQTQAQTNDAQTWFERGVAQHAQGAHEQAAASLRRSLELRPDVVPVLNALGLALSALAQADEARACYRRAIELDPAAPNLHYNLALLLCSDAPTLAEASFREAVRLNPGLSFAWNGLGLLLHDMRRFDEAEDCYRRALASGPDNQTARVNYSLTLLMQGRYEEAWPLYEARHDDFKPGAHRSAITRPQFDFPRWCGEPLNGRSLLVWPEQGFGDIIQFIRFVPELRRAGAGRITVACWPELKALLKASIDGVDWLTLNDATPIPRHDAWCFLTSLPSLLNVTLAELPGPFPYLRAPRERSRWARARLPDAPLRVGLVWGGGRRGAFAENGRSVPLSTCQPFLDMDGVTFVSLQMGDARAELSGLSDALRPIDVMEHTRDMADTAALIDGLDLVITVDTSVAHLAGALGCPVWILLRHAACWRWLDQRDDSPWYPGARLFRQPARRDWESVAVQVRTALLEWTTE
jgi:tetratricopeptide (TPR) repeat protein